MKARYEKIFYAIVCDYSDYSRGHNRWQLRCYDFIDNKTMNKKDMYKWLESNGWHVKKIYTIREFEKLGVEGL